MNTVEKYRRIEKPIKGEYPAYSEIYMSLLQDDGMILKHMEENLAKIKAMIYSLPEDKLYYRYAEDKWTIKEILVHIIDDERIFSYRAMRYGRNDSTSLHGFEQEDYAKYSYANDRSLDSIFEEYEAVRKSTLSLFQNLPEDAFMRSGGGIADDGGERGFERAGGWPGHGPGGVGSALGSEPDVGRGAARAEHVVMPRTSDSGHWQCPSSTVCWRRRFTSTISNGRRSSTSGFWGCLR